MFYLLFRRFDKNKDSTLDFREFCQMIIPQNPNFAALLTNRPDYFMHRKDFTLDNYFNLDTRYDLCRLMETLLMNELEYEKLRRQLQSMTYFNIKEAFQNMDYGLKGYLEPEDFQEFLQTNGVFKPAEIDLQALFAKFDPRGRKQVTFSDFLEELS